MTLEAAELREVRPSTPHLLLVTQKEPTQQLYRSIGFLEYDEAQYAFYYLRSAIAASWFRPLPGFSQVYRRYVSTELFPLFRERVPSSRRDDFRSTMRLLGLPQDAGPFEVLARSGGHRTGDSIELIPVPTVDPDGFVSFTFFSHGVRYMTEDAQNRIANLRAGELLKLVPELTNPVNPHAMLVTEHGRLSLGYVPDPLVDLVADISSRPHALTVERANGSDVPFHFRLMVRLAGRVDPRQPAPFTGLAWQPVD